VFVTVSHIDDSLIFVAKALSLPLEWLYSRRLQPCKQVLDYKTHIIVSFNTKLVQTLNVLQDRPLVYCIAHTRKSSCLGCKHLMIVNDAYGVIAE
jgi:hypothetical protein